MSLFDVLAYAFGACGVYALGHTIGERVGFARGLAEGARQYYMQEHIAQEWQ